MRTGEKHEKSGGMRCGRTFWLPEARLCILIVGGVKYDSHGFGSSEGYLSFT